MATPDRGHLDRLRMRAAAGVAAAAGERPGSGRRLVLSRALDALPDDMRQAISLREFDGLSYEEIAEVMNCPAHAAQLHSGAAAFQSDCPTAARRDLRLPPPASVPTD